MSSISFDPVAHIYDATRGYPEPVARQIAEAIERVADDQPQARFLEVGIGTGRIAVPLAERGRDYTGIDISQQMLNRLEAKLRASRWREQNPAWGSQPDEDVAQESTAQRFTQPGGQGSLRLVVADMTMMPFHDASFDAVIAAHVFHLVGNWQKGVQEILRIVRPGGVFLRCRDEGEQEGPRDIWREWHRIALELGGGDDRPGAFEPPITAWLQEQGMHTERLDVLTWQQMITPREIFEQIAQRQWSTTWFVPDDIFAASIERLRHWVDQRYGAAIDDTFPQERHFIIQRTPVSHLLH